MSALFVLLSNNAFCQSSQIEITSYDVSVDFRLPDNRLDVTVGLELLRADTIPVLKMLLTSHAEMASVKAKIGVSRIDMPFEIKTGDTLRLAVPSELVTKKKLMIEFKYKLPTGEFKGNVLYLDRGHRWYPLVIDQIAKFKLTVAVPSQFVVFSAGDLTGEKGLGKSLQFIWESRIPVFKIPLLIARRGYFNETMKKCGGTEICFYSPGDEKGTSQKILSEACSIFRFFNELIGEYPHKRLTIIELPELRATNIGSGLIMTGATLISQFKNDYFEGLHLPIATQWFGAGVFGEFKGKGFWFLTLSLPHHLRLMYLEKAKGEEAFIEGLNRVLDRYKEIAGNENDVPIIDIDFLNTKEKGTAIYGKGPYILELVRKQIGDDNYWTLIKSIYKDSKGKILTLDNFRDYLSKYDKDGTTVSELKKLLTIPGLPEE